MRSFVFIDWFIFLPVSGLATLSLLILISTSPDQFWHQLGFFLFGTVLYIICSTIDARIWGVSRWWVYGMSLVLLGLSYLGPTIRGSTRWIDIAGIRIQPSEVAKPLVSLVVAWYLSRRVTFSYTMVGWVTLLMSLPVFLIFHQPDLGTVLVYVMMWAGMIFMSGVPWRVIVVALLAGILFLPLSWYTLRPYQKQRIQTFLDPHVDPGNTGYNALQSVIAFGSGQIFGQGLGRGTQSHLRFLPEYHTDFIFASLGEELGLVGASLVVFLYTCLLGRVMWILSTSQDSFVRLYATSLFFQLFSQIFINIGMNIGIVPITGITLPLVSYGGSSILSIMIALGILASLVRPGPTTPLVIR